ncbi:MULTISPECIES: acyl-CoA synthetase [Comamonas]|uniref:acyl-CoA synthetase n=1 Tax=Comamonas TaxID=283 RepID=UPI0006210361|nr:MULTISPECIES: long-chain fatty acid--CoA ligase [Comamonas]KKI15258.1 fatty-acid--CoA ligase [Comamonas thiooxydans]TYK77861.1 long-chain fatty acid--CoA ligase [Comamonas sp. Z1]BCX53619.1 fatty-acid--CoA ligase [Comamonas testosteroni]
MYLTQSLRRAMQQTPHATASIYNGRKRSFAQLGERVARFAGALQALGAQAGDRVGILSLNSDWYLEYYMACYWAGVAVNPINIRWSANEIAYSLDDCDTRLLLVDDSFAPLTPELLKLSRSLQTLIHLGDGPAPQNMLSYEALVADSSPVEDSMRSGDDLAGVFYTGGTTGSPKGVMLCHRNLYTNAISGVSSQIVRAGSIGLHAAPMFHLADGAFMNALFAAGGCHVMVPRFDPLAVLQAIASTGVTDTLLVPTMIQMLVDHPDLHKYDLKSLRQMAYGASPISEGLLDRAMRTIPDVDFVQAYGMTEVSPIATILSPEMHREPGRAKGRHRSAGRATACTEVRIVDPEGREVPRGEVGEIVVRGPGVMLGYWNKPAETEAAIRDGWMHTGDGGRMDDEGYVFVVDRIKDMIVTGGENVYSIEVESVIATHPAVASCAVIGIPHEHWGEQVHVFIVLKPGQSLEAQELIHFCKERIAGYKCPRDVSFVEAMPLSGAGKILKTSLRAPFWAHHERKVT